jgi:sterol 3beta-glucosyltransferase
VHRLGAGPAPVPHQKLTVENLAAALRTATEDATIRARAQRVGQALRAEDGVARAVEVFEAYVREWRGPDPSSG